MNISHHLDAIEQGIDEVVHDVGSSGHRSGSPPKHTPHASERRPQSLELEQTKPQGNPESLATLAAGAEIITPVEVTEPSAFGASILGALDTMPQPEATSEALHLAMALLDRYLPGEDLAGASVPFEAADATRGAGTVTPSTES